MPNAIVAAFRVALAGLVALGLFSVAVRLVFLDDAAARFEPLRQWILGEPGTTVQRAAELADFDGQFSAHRWLTVIHIVSGGLFLLLVPVQLSRTVRSRFAAIHRWNGRVALATACVATAAGLYFGITTPFAGVGESVIVISVTGWFAFTLVRAYRAIRHRDIEAHREWMIRAIAVPIGVTIVRIAAALVDVAMSPAGYSGRSVFVVALCVGWATSVAVAEWWVRQTRANAG